MIRNYVHTCTYSESRREVLSMYLGMIPGPGPDGAEKEADNR